MRLEGERDGRPAPGERLRGLDHGEVAAMHAVEVPDRQGCTGKIVRQSDRVDKGPERHHLVPERPAT
jgi:hypothetical protein